MSIIAIPIETKYLRLIEMDGTRYITLHTLAEFMECSIDSGLRQLRFMLQSAESAFNQNGMRRIQHPDIEGVEQLALTLPSAIIMLSRRRSRAILALHDMLVRLICN